MFSEATQECQYFEMLNSIKDLQYKKGLHPGWSQTITQAMTFSKFVQFSALSGAAALHMSFFPNSKHFLLGRKLT